MNHTDTNGTETNGTETNTESSSELNKASDEEQSPEATENVEDKNDEL
jgi:hypothetical protein